MATAATWPLVGREAELAAVGGFMDDDAGGVLLAGPAGVGKTRLATECLALAEARGWATAQVHGEPRRGDDPVRVFAPLLPVSVSTPDGRTEALRRATAAIVEAAGGGRLMLLIDDAHELDDASSALLHLLATAPQIFPVVTVRTGEPAPEPVTALWKDELLVRIDVPELAFEDSARLVTEVLDGEVDGGTLAPSGRRAAGTPSSSASSSWVRATRARRRRPEASGGSGVRCLRRHVSGRWSGSGSGRSPTRNATRSRS